VNVPLPISEGQLLLIDPEAYVNLLEMFPEWDERARTLEDIEAFKLDKNHKLLAVGPREAVLVRRSPPGIFAYNKSARKWEPVQLEAKRG